jgi:hypothetical protein
MPGIDEETLLEIAHLQCVWRTTRGAAHALNNALTALCGLVDVPEGAGEMQEELGRCTRAARNLTAHHASRFGRMDETELVAVVRRIVPLLSDTLGSRFEVEADVPAELFHVEVDPARIELLLLTLAYHMADRSETAARLRVAAAAGDKPDTAALEVDLYAQGLDDESAETLLNPNLAERAGNAFALQAVLAVVAGCGGSLSARALPGGLRVRAVLPCESD